MKSVKPTMATLRAKHDPATVTVARCEAQLKKLRARGPEAWQYQVDFLREAGIGMTHLKYLDAYAKKHTALVREIGHKSKGKVVWLHSPKLAAQIRKEQAAYGPVEV